MKQEFGGERGAEDEGGDEQVARGRQVAAAKRWCVGETQQVARVVGDDGQAGDAVDAVDAAGRGSRIR
ncbi:hypothetical protein ETD83_37715 [Actinomadura soli]|uniref:Uncharacterized protein n=1 Tax=Actinomadura soli TaxID=2508997 RepID=A0A5C4J0F1_9ACTN|nr:hypothetical protein [Actinomadura soli]TMQ89922.1 hypothetical protein ETD83_37715 [Actinomadura soli]